MKRILILCALAALGLSSCVRDKGHYEYGPVGGVSFPEMKSEELLHIAEVGEEVVIEPRFDIDEPEAGDTFSFQWRRYVSGTELVAVTEISDDPTLRILVPDDTERKYLFMVRNDRTGVWYRAPWDHITRGAGNPLAQGFLLLVQKDEGNFDVDMLIKNDNGFEPLRYDMLSLPDEEDRFPTTGRAKQLVTINNYQSNVTGIPTWAIIVLSDQNCGLIDHNTFAKGDMMSQMVSSFSVYRGGEIVPEKIVTTGSSNTNRIRTVAFLYNGNWFWSSLVNGYRWENAVNILHKDYLDPVGKEIAVTDKACLITGHNTIVTNPHEMMLMWSDERDMFLVKTGNGNAGGDRRNTLTSKWMVDVDIPNDETDIVAQVNSEIGNNYSVEVAGREILAMGPLVKNNGIGSDGNRVISYVIAKEPGNKYAFFTINAKGGGGELEKGYYYEYPASTQVGNAKFFAISESWNYMYFATPTGVYSFRMDNLKQEVAITTAKKGNETIDIVPAGEEIVVFKSLYAENSNWIGGENNNNILVVTRNGDGECTFRIYEQTGNGYDLQLSTYTKKVVVSEEETTETQEFMEFTGLRDVVDVAWKFQ